MINLTTTGGNKISCNTEKCGGIVGFMSGLLLQSSNSATVRGASEIGGLVGRISEISHIINSQNNGIVEGGEEDVGGAIGKIKSKAALVSYVSNSARVTKEKSGRGKDFGGLIGAISDSKAVSKFVRIFQSKCIGSALIDGNYGVGGLIGRIDDKEARISIEQSSTTCNIEILDNPKTGGSYSGGFIGWIEKGSVKISESYSNSDITVEVKSGQKLRKPWRVNWRGL